MGALIGTVAMALGAAWGVQTGAQEAAPIVAVPPALHPAPPAPPPLPRPLTIVPRPADAPPVSLRGAHVKFYNFLDVREDEYTPAVLTEVETQLAAGLQPGGVRIDRLRFKDTPSGLTFANVIGGAIIPVGEVIEAQRAADTAAGVAYRLIAFPANYQVVGAWRYYTIRWLLLDAATDQLILRSEYEGRHMVVFKNSEGAVKRGKKLVDHVLAAMKAKALI